MALLVLLDKICKLYCGLHCVNIDQMINWSLFLVPPMELKLETAEESAG